MVKIGCRMVNTGTVKNNKQQCRKSLVKESQPRGSEKTRELENATIQAKLLVVSLELASFGPFHLVKAA